MSLSRPDVSEISEPLTQEQQHEQDVALVLQSALELHRNGAYEDAKSLYEVILNALPQHADAQYGLAMLKVQIDQPAEALAHFEIALGANPDNSHFWVNYISALNRCGQTSAAWIAVDIAQQRGVKGAELDWLITRMATPTPLTEPVPTPAPKAAAVEDGPGVEKAGIAAPAEQMEPAARPALAVLRKAKQPTLDKLSTLTWSGRPAEAVKLASKLVTEYPSDGRCWCALALALHQIGHFDDLIHAGKQALELLPTDVTTRRIFANALRETGRLTEAEVQCRQILDKDPNDVNAIWQLCFVMHGQNRIDEAATAGWRAVELAPNNPMANLNLGLVLLDQGHVSDALRHLRRAIELDPKDGRNNSAILFRLTHNHAIDAATLLDEHRAFGKRHGGQVAIKKYSNSPDPDRRIRIGLLSGDLRNHAVTTYLGPIIEHLANDPSLSLHFYYNNSIEDQITRFLRMRSASWTDITGLNDISLAAKIRRDAIDIVVDLSGHTSYNRLTALAQKPAPIQATWLGYPATTGLEAMDYFVADPFLAPKGLAEAQFVEKFVRLPSIVPYCPIANSPPVNVLPALHKKHMTYGSFNRMNKVDQRVIGLWARILRSDTNAQMIIGAIDRDIDQQTCIERFAAEGIDAKRLSFRHRANTPVYLQQHHQVDICLDTFPYSGATTTINALWMGVPTLTIAGDSMQGRGSVAWLSQLGVTQYIARDPDDFVQRALTLSEDLDALSQLRSVLRERCLNATAIQPAIVAASLSTALRTMWRRWCAGLAPDSFDVAPMPPATLPQAAQGLHAA